MKTYVACIGEESVLAFRAEDDDEARAMIDDQEGGMRSDLKALVGADGKGPTGRADQLPDVPEGLHRMGQGAGG